LAALTELDAPPDIIDVFRRPIYLHEVVGDAERARAHVLSRAGDMADGPRWVIWTQLGVVNSQAARRARDLGFLVVEDRCLRVEHSRLGIGPVA
jgi:predicted CoA-binding protein